MFLGMVLNRGDGGHSSGFSFGQRCWSHWVSKAGLIIQDGEEEESGDMKTAMRWLTCVNLGEAKDAASLPLLCSHPNTLLTPSARAIDEIRPCRAAACKFAEAKKKSRENDSDGKKKNKKRK